MILYVVFDVIRIRWELSSVDYSLSFREFRRFGVCGLSETNIKNSPVGTKIVIFAEKYDFNLMILYVVFDVI